jgi:ABC-type transport system involved in multi-copper enzyme maturation permease subunit
VRLREVYRFELAYTLRSVPTWIYSALLFLFAGWISLGSYDGDIPYNAPIRMAFASMAAGMFGLLVTAGLFGAAAVRDTEAEMDPLLFTSPLTRTEYLAGRFLAALTVNAVLLLAIPLGLGVATLLMHRFAPDSVGPIHIVAYLQPIPLLLIPSLLFSGAILFTVAMLARQVIPVYVGAIVMFIGGIVAANYPGRIDNPLLAALADPFGLAALQELARYWTQAEQNTRLVGFPGTLALNRAVWLAVAAGMLVVLHRTFRFAHADGGRRRERARAIVETETKPLGPVVVPRVAGSFGTRTKARQTLAIAHNALAEFMATCAFSVVLLACVGLTMLWGWNVGDTIFDTHTWPVTFLVAETALSIRVAPLFHLLIALYAGELVWKERDVGAAEIAEASPVPEGAALLGRFVALVAMLVMFQAASLVGGILIQALQGYYKFEPGLYLRVVFGLNLASYVLVAALAMTIHVVVNHKYLGHMVVVMGIIFPRIAPAFGIRHNLLRYGMDPGWTYSDMNGFGPFIGPFVWFKLYWAAWALLLMVLATALWVRGREPGMGCRLRLARARFIKGRALARAAGTAVALILVFGGFIFYNTNVLNTYASSDEAGRRQAEYEKRYGRFEGTPQPTITSADLRVEIYPDDPAVDLRGTFHIVNRTAAAIDSVHVSLTPDLEARSFSFDRVATPALTDADVGYRIWVLDHELKPGDSLALSFDVSWRARGFTNGRMPTNVVKNGTYFNRRWLPFIGYQPLLELSDTEARKRFGLEPRPPGLKPDDPAARQRRTAVTDGDLVQVSAVLGTSAEQIALTPGVLRRSWTENGRRYFHYETEKPESFGAAVLSGTYAVLEDRWKDVPLRIFHYPPHTFNLERMVRSMKASLEYFTAEFSPYPDTHLRIIEIPRYDRGGSAHPNTIVFAEDNFLTRVDGDEFDLAFFGTAHEVAHTWWGGQVRGAPGVRGQGLLTEALANYSAMMVTEKTYGTEAARRVYDFQMDRYLRRRSEMGRDVPLLEVEDQPWIYYGKGAVAMYLLREHIGDDAVNTALRRYLEKHRAGKPPYPTSLDLYAELRAVTPDSMQYLLRDLFETITLWDVETRSAVVERTGTGEYEVTLDVVAKKVTADSVGRETEVPMDDLVEIGVFPPGDGDSSGAPLYLERHRIKSGKQTISVTVPREPARAGIDPYRKLIDRARDDNVVDVQLAK